MKEQETLHGMTFLTDFLDFIHGNLNLLFANGVMAPGIVIGSVFFASDQLISAEQLSVSASSNLIWKNGFFLYYIIVYLFH